jgi:hypothetical protein
MLLRSSLLNSPELRFIARRCDQRLMDGKIGPVMRFVRDSSESRPGGKGFEHGSAHELRVKGKFGDKEIGSTAVDGEGNGAKQVLKGPATGQMEADAAGRLAYASTDFEELGTQGFDLSRAPGLGQLKAKQVD